MPDLGQPTLFDLAADEGPEDLKEATSLAALMSLPNIGSTRAIKLAAHFRNWDNLRRAQPDLIRAVAGVDLGDWWPEPISAPSNNGLLIGFFDPAYPDSLRSITSAPAVLWTRGELKPSAKRVAIVGGRDASDWGTGMARAIAGQCVELGYEVVSGLAFGVDIAAHRAAIERSGTTIAVLGSSLDRISPQAHKGDAERIIEAGGALVSESPPGTEASPQSLVARNRIQTGLSAKVLVIQCGPTSGTLRTARFAAEQGRPLAIPVPPPDEQLRPSSAGSMDMLKDGIKLSRRSVPTIGLHSSADLQEFLDQV